MTRTIDVEVELHMFMDGIVRVVPVPYIDIATAPTLSALLDRVCFWGQNTVQPQEDRRSVSVGDIIRWEGKRYLVRVGFERIDDPQFPRSKQELLERLRLQSGVLPCDSSV